MNPPPLIPENAPFTAEQRAWLNGFLAGWVGQTQSSSHALTAAGNKGNGATTKPLLLLFGSQSGTAESLARSIAKQSRNKGFAAKVSALDDVGPEELSTQSRLLVITSTWGEGEMPDNAKQFWQKVSDASAPALKHVNYSVLALGDKNYGETFCLAGKEIDRRLEELGANRVHPRVDCDVQYDADASAWSSGVFDALEKLNTASNIQLTEQAIATSAHAASPAPASWSRNNPFLAKLKQKHCLNKLGSKKSVHHIEISLAGSDLVYEPGDALGVIPQNCPDFVQEILSSASLSGAEMVPGPDDDTELPLQDALLTRYELKPFVAQLPQAGISAKELVASLKKIAPRLYSIASSLRKHPGEVHLTVGAVKFEIDGRPRKGACSTFLSERMHAGGNIPVYIQKSHGFRLPENPETTVIMVGPGTGIAPFRAFLEERSATGATGKNWLFFGDQKRESDFLYEEELLSYQTSGVLSRLDLAFSRDQAEKIYVQNRMQEQASELWHWLESGAHFYVCGDASRMAKDVDAALRHIVQEQGKLSEDVAIEYLTALKKQKRYQRDVY